MRSLVINLGNTSIFGGHFDGTRLEACFKLSSRLSPRTLAKKLSQHIPSGVERLALCSVVPDLTAPVSSLLRRKTGLEPQLLHPEAQHGLRIGYREPKRLGSDRLAAALGAQSLAAGKNLIVVDCGTATTVTALDKTGLLAGGAILPGLGLWAEVLAAQTAQLPRITPSRPHSPLGRSPEEAIASGLFHGHAGAIRELVKLIAQKSFKNESYTVFGTGGNAPLFAKEKLFTAEKPYLILNGLLAFATVSKDHA